MKAAKRAYRVVGIVVRGELTQPKIRVHISPYETAVWLCTSYDIRRGDYVIINDAGLATWPAFGQPIEIDGIGEVYADGEGGFTMRGTR